MKRRGDLELHFARLWPDRHDDHVHVFANGHVFDRAERRKSLRMLVAMMRRERAAGYRP